MAPYKGLKIVTYHRSWTNFADALRPRGHRLRRAKARHPALSGATRSASSKEMKRQNVKILLVDPYFDMKTPNAIGRDTGAKVLMMPPSVGGVPEASNYIALFDYDINLFVSTHEADGDTVAMSGLTIGEILNFLAAPFVASLILTGHPFLSGRARR